MKKKKPRKYSQSPRAVRERAYRARLLENAYQRGFSEGHGKGYSEGVQTDVFLTNQRRLQEAQVRLCEESARMRGAHDKEMRKLQAERAEAETIRAKMEKILAEMEAEQAAMEAAKEAQE